jgi:hypothetical protein
MEAAAQVAALHGDDGAAGWFAGANGEYSRLAQKYSESRESFELRTIGGYRASSWLLAVNPVFGWNLSQEYRSGTPDFSLGVKATHNVGEKTAVGLEYYSEMGTTSHILPLARQANSLFAVIDTEFKSLGINFASGAGSRAPRTSGPSRPSSPFHCEEPSMKIRTLVFAALAAWVAAAQAAPPGADAVPGRIVLLVDEYKAIRNFPIIVAERLGYLSEGGATVTVMNIRDDIPTAQMLQDGRSTPSWPTTTTIS